jgi:outer membrane protein assembly factor BamA
MRVRARRVCRSLLTVGIFLVSAARAQVPVPTADDPEDTGEWKAPRTEANVLPAAGGDTDIGIGGGGLFDIARVKPYVVPYAWRVEGSGFIAFKLRDEALHVTYQDYYFQWTAPHALTDRLRLEVRPSFTMEPTQKYFGIGNAAPDVREGHDYGSDTRYFEFSRTRASLQVTARIRLSGPLHAQVSPSYTQNWLDVREDSALSTDMRTGGPKVRELLGDTRPHGVARLEYGIVWDTRNDEVSTAKGGFHHVKLRLSPGGSGEVPYRFGQVNVTTRFYVTPVRGVTLAIRLVGDLLFGSPPFYELARYEDTYAFGGANGVRGIPAQRYYGKIKAFGNFEARFRVAEFLLLGKASKFSLVTFADGGRLWTDYKGTGDLDGRLLNIKYGLGGGFRLQQGETFLLRADVAWSPDARPIGVYFDASQAF